ncbi:MAG: MarR family winged helix-turn-helix transcriptional regulator [Actinomycetota bacterium]|nr:MarR family winged helix-turn-helix transcriptional regulator [Actinomycetota bacterium]
MTGFYTLNETEKTISEKLSGLPIDFQAQATVANLYRAANATRKYFTNTVLKDYDLSWTGFVVLWVVWIFDGIETRHAADEAGISKSTLSGIIKTMESRGLLERRFDASDKRLVHLHLTQNGGATMVELFPKFNLKEVETVSPLDKGGVDQLGHMLKSIITHLESFTEVSMESRTTPWQGINK